MSAYSDSKIAEHHLNRQALIYVRQSSMKQVMENTESTARQYALVDRSGKRDLSDLRPPTR